MAPRMLTGLRRISMRRAKGNMMIRNSLNKLAVAFLFLVGLISFQGVALDDVTDVPMQLTGLNTGYSMGGVYTSPYQIQIDGADTLVLACDDFTTDISFGYTWHANKNTLSSVTDNGPQKFTHATNPTVTYPGVTSPTDYSIQQQYDAAAWLAEQLLTVPSILTDPTTAGEYS